MHERYFGDSYDIVKQSILRWLQPFGEWSVHPMLTEKVSPKFVSSLETFLDATVISTGVLTTTTDRSDYFSCAHRCGNLFLDPNTGMKVNSFRGARSPNYLFASDLAQIIERRATSLTIVFDQSVARGSEEKHIAAKLQHLLSAKTSAFAYLSHACFIIAGSDYSLVNRARNALIEASRLPAKRLLRIETKA